MRLRLLLLLLALTALLLLAAPAWAHSGGAGALIHVSPARPEPDQVTPMTVTLTDALGAPIPEAHLRVTVRPQGQPVPAAGPLQEAPAGTYSGPVRFPGPGMAIIQVEATLPDGLWLGEVPIKLGPDGYEIDRLFVSVNHQDGVAVGANPGAASVDQGAPGAQPASFFLQRSFLLLLAAIVVFGAGVFWLVWRWQERP